MPLVVAVVVSVAGYCSVAKFNKNQLTTQYFSLIGDESYQNDKKALLIANLLREEIVNVDLLFSMTYEHMSLNGGDALTALIYQYAKDGCSELALSPIGTLGFPASKNEESFKFGGWALGTASISYVDITVGDESHRFRVDGSHVSKPDFGIALDFGKQRSDVAEILGKKYENTMSSGFELSIEHRLLDKKGLTFMRFRVTDDLSRNQTLFEGNVQIYNGMVYRQPDVKKWAI